MSKQTARNWRHDELAEDLAIAKGPTPFLNVPLGSVWLQQSRNYSAAMETALNGDGDFYEARKKLKSTQLADVIIIKPSYTRFCVSIFEIKVSRADFLSDIRGGKWRGYLDHCHRFYFAVAHGVATKEDIPSEAGLIVRGPKGWNVQKGAPVQDTEIPHETLLSMLFTKQRESFGVRNRDRIIHAFRHYGTQRDKVKAIGRELADAWGYRDEYLRKKKEFERLIQNIRDNLNEALGIDDSWPEWDLKKLVKEIREKAAREVEADGRGVLHQAPN